MLKTVAYDSILPENVRGYINSKISIPLIIKNREKMLSADIQLLYDPDQLEFIDVKKTALTHNFYLIFNILPGGKIKIAMYILEPIKLNGEFIRLEFMIINKKKTDITTLKVTSLRINSLMPVSDQTTVLMLDKGNIKKAIDVKNIPNPFNPVTKIYYQNIASGHGQLIIYDMLGKQVRHFDLGYIAPGVHELFWDGRDNNGKELASGVYFVKFICEKEIRINKMIKLK